MRRGVFFSKKKNFPVFTTPSERQREKLRGVWRKPYNKWDSNKSVDSSANIISVIRLRTMRCDV